MTHDEIIRAANQVWRAGDMYIGPSIETLEQFARLIYEAVTHEIAEYFSFEGHYE